MATVQFDPSQPFETTPPDSGKPAFDPSQPFSTQAPGAAQGSAPVVSSAPAQFDPTQPYSTSPTAAELATQDHSAIFQHAAGNFNPDDPWSDPEMETAYQADKLRRARGIAPKTAEFVKAIPGGIWSGVKGVGKFAIGVPEALGNVWQGAYRQAMGDERYRTNQAQATLAAQHAEESLRNAGTSIVSTYARNAPGFLDPLLYGSPEAKEATARLLFAQRVQQAQNELKLSQGRPLDTGAIASLYHAAGQQPSEDISPEALKAAGVDQADLATAENMAAAGDPQMLLLAKAPMLPGASKIGGRIAQGAGKLAQVPMNAVEAAVGAGARHLGPTGKIAAAMMGGAGAIEAAPVLLHHPIIAAGAVATKGLQMLGRAAEAQGAELATGIPSELSQNVAKAAATGKSAIGDSLKMRAGNAVAQGASTAVGMTPLNAATSDGDPTQFAQSEAGAAAFGGAFGSLARNRPMMVEAVRPFLRQEGTRAMAEAADANDPLAIKSAAYIASLPEQARNSTLEAIGALQGLPATQGEAPKRAKLYVLNDSDYRDVLAQKFGMQQAAMGGGRGFFIGDDGAAYVNGDYHSGLDPAELNHTVGHEFGGHAAINVMQAMGAKGGALYNGLVNSVKAKLLPNGRPTADFYRFIREYNKAFDPSGQTQRLSFNDPEAIEEWISEQAGQIMAGRGAGELALPQTIQDKINQGLGQFMGRMLGVDKRKVGTPTNFGREEVGALTQAVQDTLGQVVGMKLRGGAEIPEPAKTSQRRIDELNAVLAKPRPSANAPLTEMQAWIAEQKAARSELSSLQGSQTGQTPAPGQPPVATNAPQAPVDPIPAQTAAKARLAAQQIIPAIQNLFGGNVTAAKAAIDAVQAAAAEPITDPGELLKAVLARAEALKKPAPPPPQPTPIQPPNGPTGTQPPPPNKPVPPGRVDVLKEPSQGVAPTEPVPVHTTDDLEQIAAQAREEFLSDKEPAKSGKNKGQHTAANVKAAEKAAFDAAAEAHGETVPENYQGIRQRTDAFGNKTVSGTVDPSRPFDAWMIQRAMQSGHLTPETLQTLLDLQNSIGKTVSYDYGHAPVADEGDMPTKGGRAAAQAESSVADRLAGGPVQTERKTSVPLRVEFNPGTDSFTVYGVSQEKLLNNFNHLAEKMGDLGIPMPFRDINDPRFVAAFKAIIRNQEHGWTGDGKSPSVGTEEFPNTPDPEWAKSPEHQIVPDDQFQFINAILADEGAKPPKRGDASIAKAKAHLANENQRLLNPEGETNPLRQQINDATPPENGKTWSKATLEDPLNENISPALASNLGEASQSDESIRQHGKVGDISRFFDKGQTPDRAKTSAGFLPDTGGNQSSALKFPPDGRLSDSEFLSDLSKRPSFISQGLRVLDGETNRRMVETVLRLSHDPKILDSIIGLLPVDVVNNFGGKELATQMLLHDQAVLKIPPTSDSGLNVSSGVDVSSDPRAVITSATAKMIGSSPNFRSSLIKLLLAKSASDSGHGTIMTGDTADATSFNTGAPKTPQERAKERIAAREGFPNSANDLFSSLNDNPDVEAATGNEKAAERSRTASAYIAQKLKNDEAEARGFRPSRTGEQARMRLAKRAYVDDRGSAEGFDDYISNMEDLLQHREKGMQSGQWGGQANFMPTTSDPERTEMSNGSVTKGPGVQFLPAFHGTPHKVDKFSVDKIGTGEGAQVYGWGLYFSERNETAKHYKTTLEGKGEYDGGPYDSSNPRHIAASILDTLKGDRKEAIKGMLENAGEATKPGEKEHYKEIAKILRENKEANLNRPGKLYTVDIDAEPHELLDYDKPLSGQPEIVKKLDAAGFGKFIGSDTGKVYAPRTKEEADELIKAGIVGIQYLDQGSRGQRFQVLYGNGKPTSSDYPTKEEANRAVEMLRKGGDKGASMKEIQPTRNFVVFDDSRIKITHENGQPVTGQDRRDALGQESPQQAAKARLASFMPTTKDLERMALDAEGVQKNDTETQAVNKAVPGFKTAPEAYVDKADGLQVGATTHGQSRLGTLTGMVQVAPEGKVPNTMSRAFFRVKFDEPIMINGEELHEGLVNANNLKILSKQAKFMPTTGDSTPAPGGAGSPEGREPSGSQPRPLSTGGTSKDDSSKNGGGDLQSLAALPRDKFRKKYVVHFDTRPDAESRIDFIMGEGFKTGMISSDIDNFTPEGVYGPKAAARGWARASGSDKPGAIAYVVEDKSVPSDNRMKPGTKPVAWVRLTKEGQSVHDAILDSQSKAKFLPDTGKPEEGETPGERLMREAEAAGLQPSIEVMKGVLRGDNDAFEKLRAMIKSRTGRDAKFMPASQRPSAKEAARARIAARSIVPVADDRRRQLQESR